MEKRIISLVLEWMLLPLDSDEILEVSFDLLYDDDGDSETTDISLLSAFEFNGKQYDGFKIYDPDSIAETEITIDPVTQETYANGQPVNFDPETFTINVENLGVFHWNGDNY